MATAGIPALVSSNALALIDMRMRAQGPKPQALGPKTQAIATVMYL